MCIDFGDGIFHLQEGVKLSVSDLDPPVFEPCPEQVLEVAPPGMDYATVSWEVPTATDNVDGSIHTSLVQSNVVENTGVFPVGDNWTIWYKAADSVGNVGECKFDVVVKDEENPVIMCPKDPDPVNNSPGRAYGIVTWDSPRVFDNHRARVFASALSGDKFPVGQTLVNFTAVDWSGNSAQCSIRVTVTDVEPPILICPPSVSRYSPNKDDVERVDSWPEPFVEENDKLSELYSSHTAPYDFTFGMHTITYTAVDVSGLVGQCNFYVDIRGLPCEYDPCMNGGVCSDISTSSFSCTCSNGYFGERCEQGAVVVVMRLNFSDGLYRSDLNAELAQAMGIPEFRVPESSTDLTLFPVVKFTILPPATGREIQSLPAGKMLVENLFPNRKSILYQGQLWTPNIDPTFDMQLEVLNAPCSNIPSPCGTRRGSVCSNVYDEQRRAYVYDCVCPARWQGKNCEIHIDQPPSIKVFLDGLLRVRQFEPVQIPIQIDIANTIDPSGAVLMLQVTIEASKGSFAMQSEQLGIMEQDMPWPGSKLQIVGLTSTLNNALETLEYYAQGFGTDFIKVNVTVANDPLDTDTVEIEVNIDIKYLPRPKMRPPIQVLSNSTSDQIGLSWGDYFFVEANQPQAILYQVQMQNPADQKGTPILVYLGPDLHTIVRNNRDTKLEIGATRRFRVSGKNLGGWSDWSVWSDASTKNAVPGSVTFNSSTSTPTSITLHWNTPIDDGGSPIVVYKVEVLGLDYFVNDNIVTVDELKPETDYVFRVAAVNAQGLGTWSVPFVATTEASGPRIINFYVSQDDDPGKVQGMVVEFDTDVNQIPLSTTDNVDALFSFSPQYPGVYSGQWLSPRKVLLRQTDSEFDSPPPVGLATVSTKDSTVQLIAQGGPFAPASSSTSPPLNYGWQSLELPGMIITNNSTSPIRLFRQPLPLSVEIGTDIGAREASLTYTVHLESPSLNLYLSDGPGSREHYLQKSGDLDNLNQVLRFISVMPSSSAESGIHAIVVSLYRSGQLVDRSNQFVAVKTVRTPNIDVALTKIVLAEEAEPLDAKLVNYEGLNQKYRMKIFIGAKTSYLSYDEEVRSTVPSLSIIPDDGGGSTSYYLVGYPHEINRVLQTFRVTVRKTLWYPHQFVKFELDDTSWRWDQRRYAPAVEKKTDLMIECNTALTAVPDSVIDTDSLCSTCYLKLSLNHFIDNPTEEQGNCSSYFSPATVELLGGKEAHCMTYGDQLHIDFGEYPSLNPGKDVLQLTKGFQTCPTSTSRKYVNTVLPIKTVHPRHVASPSVSISGPTRVSRSDVYIRLFIISKGLESRFQFSWKLWNLTTIETQSPLLLLRVTHLPAAQKFYEVQVTVVNAFGLQANSSHQFAVEAQSIPQIRIRGLRTRIASLGTPFNLAADVGAPGEPQFFENFPANTIFEWSVEPADFDLSNFTSSYMTMNTGKLVSETEYRFTLTVSMDGIENRDSIFAKFVQPMSIRSLRASRVPGDNQKYYFNTSVSGFCEDDVIYRWDCRTVDGDHCRHLRSEVNIELSSFGASGLLDVANLRPGAYKIGVRVECGSFSDFDEIVLDVSNVDVARPTSAQCVSKTVVHINSDSTLQLTPCVPNDQSTRFTWSSTSFDLFNPYTWQLILNRGSRSFFTPGTRHQFSVRIVRGLESWSIDYIVVVNQRPIGVLSALAPSTTHFTKIQLVNVLPSRGISFGTSFSFFTVGWENDDPSDPFAVLRYQFFWKDIRGSPVYLSRPSSEAYLPDQLFLPFGLAGGLQVGVRVMDESGESKSAYTVLDVSPPSDNLVNYLMKCKIAPSKYRFDPQGHAAWICACAQNLVLTAQLATVSRSLYSDISEALLSQLEQIYSGLSMISVLQILLHLKDLALSSQTVRMLDILKAAYWRSKITAPRESDTNEILTLVLPLLRGMFQSALNSPEKLDYISASMIAICTMLVNLIPQRIDDGEVFQESGIGMGIRSQRLFKSNTSMTVTSGAQWVELEPPLMSEQEEKSIYPQSVGLIYPSPLTLDPDVELQIRENIISPLILIMKPQDQRDSMVTFQMSYSSSQCSVKAYPPCEPECYTLENSVTLQQGASSTGHFVWSSVAVETLYTGRKDDLIRCRVNTSLIVSPIIRVSVLKYPPGKVDIFDARLGGSTYQEVVITFTGLTDRAGMNDPLKLYPCDHLIAEEMKAWLGHSGISCRWPLSTSLIVYPGSAITAWPGDVVALTDGAILSPNTLAPLRNLFSVLKAIENPPDISIVIEGSTTLEFCEDLELDASHSFDVFSSPLRFLWRADATELKGNQVFYEELAKQANSSFLRIFSKYMAPGSQTLVLTVTSSLGSTKEIRVPITIRSKNLPLPRISVDNVVSVIMDKTVDIDAGIVIPTKCIPMDGMDVVYRWLVDGQIEQKAPVVSNQTFLKFFHTFSKNSVVVLEVETRDKAGILRPGIQSNQTNVELKKLPVPTLIEATLDSIQTYSPEINSFVDVIALVLIFDEPTNRDTSDPSRILDGPTLRALDYQTLSASFHGKWQTARKFAISGFDTEGIQESLENELPFTVGINMDVVSSSAPGAVGYNKATRVQLQPIAAKLAPVAQFLAADYLHNCQNFRGDASISRGAYSSPLTYQWSLLTSGVVVGTVEGTGKTLQIAPSKLGYEDEYASALRLQTSGSSGEFLTIALQDLKLNHQYSVRLTVTNWLHMTSEFYKNFERLGSPVPRVEFEHASKSPVIKGEPFYLKASYGRAECDPALDQANWTIRWTYSDSLTDASKDLEVIVLTSKDGKGSAVYQVNTDGFMYGIFYSYTITVTDASTGRSNNATCVLFLEGASGQTIVARFDASGGSIIVDFSENIGTPPELSDPRYACALISNAKSSLLGSGFYCYWSTTTRYIVQLGYSPKIRFAEDNMEPSQAELSYLVVDYAQLVEPMHVPVMPSENVIQPRAIIIGPRNVPSCTDTVLFDGSTSTGNAGRPFVSQLWSFYGVSLGLGPVLEVPAIELQRIIEQNNKTLDEGIRLDVINWLGYAHGIAQPIKLLPFGSSAVPIQSYSGPYNRIVETKDQFVVIPEFACPLTLATFEWTSEPLGADYYNDVKPFRLAHGIQSLNDPDEVHTFQLAGKVAGGYEALVTDDDKFVLKPGRRLAIDVLEANRVTSYPDPNYPVNAKYLVLASGGGDANRHSGDILVEASVDSFGVRADQIDVVWSCKLAMRLESYLDAWAKGGNPLISEAINIGCFKEGSPWASKDLVTNATAGYIGIPMTELRMAEGEAMTFTARATAFGIKKQPSHSINLYFSFKRFEGFHVDLLDGRIPDPDVPGGYTKFPVSKSLRLIALLHSGVLPDPGQYDFHWKVPGRGFSLKYPEQIETNDDLPIMKLAPGVLKPNTFYTFVFTAQKKVNGVEQTSEASRHFDEEPDGSSEAFIHVFTNGPPTGGLCMAPNIQAFDPPVFTLELRVPLYCRDWTDLPEDLPLQYAYYIQYGGSLLEIRPPQQSSYVRLRLPPAKEEQPYSLFARVSDKHGESRLVEFVHEEVMVKMPPSYDPQMIQSLLNELSWAVRAVDTVTFVTTFISILSLLDLLPETDPSQQSVRSSMLQNLLDMHHPWTEYGQTRTDQEQITWVRMLKFLAIPDFAKFGIVDDQGEMVAATELRNFLNSTDLDLIIYEVLEISGELGVGEIERTPYFRQYVALASDLLTISDYIADLQFQANTEDDLLTRQITKLQKSIFATEALARAYMVGALPGSPMLPITGIQGSIAGERIFIDHITGDYFEATYGVHQDIVVRYSLDMLSSSIFKGARIFDHIGRVFEVTGGGAYDVADIAIVYVQPVKNDNSIGTFRNSFTYADNLTSPMSVTFIGASIPETSAMCDGYPAYRTCWWRTRAQCESLLLSKTGGKLDGFWTKDKCTLEQKENQTFTCTCTVVGTAFTIRVVDYISEEYEYLHSFTFENLQLKYQVPVMALLLWIAFIVALFLASGVDGDLGIKTPNTVQRRKYDDMVLSYGTLSARLGSRIEKLLLHRHMWLSISRRRINSRYSSVKRAMVAFSFAIFQLFFTSIPFPQKVFTTVEEEFRQLFVCVMLGLFGPIPLAYVLASVWDNGDQLYQGAFKAKKHHEDKEGPNKKPKRRQKEEDREVSRPVGRYSLFLCDFRNFGYSYSVVNATNSKDELDNECPSLFVLLVEVLMVLATLGATVLSLWFGVQFELDYPPEAFPPAQIWLLSFIVSFLGAPLVLHPLLIVFQALLLSCCGRPYSKEDENFDFFDRPVAAITTINLADPELSQNTPEGLVPIEMQYDEQGMEQFDSSVDEEDGFLLDDGSDRKPEPAVETHAIHIPEPPVLSSSAAPVPVPYRPPPQPRVIGVPEETTGLTAPNKDRGCALFWDPDGPKDTTDSEVGVEHGPSEEELQSYQEYLKQQEVYQQQYRQYQQFKDYQQQMRDYQAKLLESAKNIQTLERDSTNGRVSATKGSFSLTL